MSRCRTLAAAQAATAASTMMAPWERLRTPETPKISVKPVAPSAYNALMAKPSISIWSASIYNGRSNPLPHIGEKPETRKSSRDGPGSSFIAASIRGDLDEARELQLSLRDLFRPDRNLLAVLPLQHEAGDQALAVFQAMGEVIVLAVELDAADGPFPIGLFQRVHHLVGIGRAGPLDGVGDVINLVIGGVAGIGRVVGVLLVEG